jgi:hypothetical protein
MQKFIFGLLALLLFAVVIPACKDKEDDELSGFNDVEIEFDNRAGNASLVFGTEYTNAAGEKLKFSTFNYFVSNFVLVHEDGTEYIVPKDSCYFLCKHDDPDSREVVLKNVPSGNYTALKFMIGVDSAKSVSPIGERTGVLDPAAGANGMYWSWNAGYIFVKIEGTSPQAPLDPGTNENTFQYHTGLFGGLSSPTLNNLKTVTMATHHGEPAMVRRSGGPHFHVYVDVLEMFTNPTNISVAANPTSHAGPYSKTVADNYADMFILDHVHNP